MARPLRIEFPGALYHVTARGNARQDIFLDDEDRHLFLSVLDRVVSRFRLRLHACCLTDNHYHLLLETPEGNLSKALRQLNGVYTQAFNRRHGKVGHVLQGRFEAILVERDSYLLELCRYIVLDPVRARITRKPDRYRWSSYRASAGLEPVPGFLMVDWLLSQFGGQRAAAQRRYQTFVAEGIGQTSPWEKVQGQVLLGGQSICGVPAARPSGQPLDQGDPPQAALRRQTGTGYAVSLTCCLTCGSATRSFAGCRRGKYAGLTPSAVCSP